MKSRHKRHKYNHGKWVLTILVFFSFASLSCAMGTNGEKQPPVVTDDKANSQKIVLVEILSNADIYNAKVVKVAGVFKGWKGKCGSSFSITRSDWILGDGPDCIYVSGLLPSGVSTARPGNERVEVTGKVKVAADGKVHLKAMKIKVFQ
ncbi:MAG: hypothetical protein PVI89_10890 [Desulfobacteraceae bacterium]|jgi:hypothetical protein